MSIREQLRGVIRRSRDIGDDADEDEYDVLDAERRVSGQNQPRTTTPPKSPPTRSTLQQMMDEQSNQLRAADDKHKKEYLPLLDEAIRAVGGDPHAPSVSGGSGSLAYSNSPSRSPVQRGRSPTLRQVLAGQAVPTTNNTPGLPRSTSNVSANRSPHRPISPPARKSPDLSTSKLTKTEGNSPPACGLSSKPELRTQSGTSQLTSSITSDVHVGVRSLDSTLGGPDLLDSTQRPQNLQSKPLTPSQITQTPPQGQSSPPQDTIPRPSSPATTSPVSRSPRSYGGGVIRSPSGPTSMSLKDMMNSRDLDLKEAEKGLERHKVLRDSAIREIERLESEGKWKKM